MSIFFHEIDALVCVHGNVVVLILKCTENESNVMYLEQVNMHLYQRPHTDSLPEVQHLWIRTCKLLTIQCQRI